MEHAPDELRFRESKDAERPKPGSRCLQRVGIATGRPGDSSVDVAYDLGEFRRVALYEVPENRLDLAEQVRVGRER